MRWILRVLIAPFLVALAGCFYLGFLSATEVNDPTGRMIVRVLSAVAGITSLAAALWLAWPQQGQQN
jgi:hypothetical protein